MNGHSIVYNTAIHVLNTNTLNNGVDTATRCVECGRTTVGGSRPVCLGDSLTQPTGEALFRQGLPSHAIPEAHKQLIGASDGGCLFIMAWQHANWAQYIQSCLPRLCMGEGGVQSENCPTTVTSK